MTSEKKLLEEAEEIVIRAAGFSDPETLEASIPLMIWMYRNNVKRDMVIENLTMLVREYKNLEAAKAVIMLKLSPEDTGDMATSKEIWRGVTDNG